VGHAITKELVDFRQAAICYESLAGKAVVKLEVRELAKSDGRWRRSIIDIPSEELVNKARAPESKWP